MLKKQINVINSKSQYIMTSAWGKEKKAMTFQSEGKSGQVSCEECKAPSYSLSFSKAYDKFLQKLGSVFQDLDAQNSSLMYIL